MQWQSIARAIAKPVLGALRYALTLCLFCGLWWYDARFLNQAFATNLSLLKSASAVVDGSGKTEAMLRAFSAEKMLLFAEGSGCLWLLGATGAAIGKRAFGRRSAGAKPSDGRAIPPKRR